MTDEEKLKFWSDFHQKMREKRARDLEFYGPGYQKRRERIQDILTGRALLRSVQGVMEQTGALFDKISEKLGTKVVEIDRTVEPTFKVNLGALLKQDNQPVASSAEFFDELNRALNGMYDGETFPLATQNTTAIVQAASTELTAAPKAIALDLGNGKTAQVEGFGGFDEILTKIEYGFPENELPELLNLLRSQRDDGVEQVSDAFARQLFFRAAVRLVERSLNPETAGGIEGDRLLYFALAIKGLRPDIDNLDTFKDISRELHKHLQATQYPGLLESNVISIFNRVREPHVYDALHRATDAPALAPDDSIAPLVLPQDMDRALAEGFDKMSVADGGGAASDDGKVVPLRPVPPKSDPEDPKRNP